MTGKSVVEKLLIKPGHRGRLFNPPGPYEDCVGPLPDNALVVGDEADCPVDVVHVFVTSADELEELLPRAVAALRPDGLLWTGYPRVSVAGHRISREAVHAALRANGWRPVTQIAIDQVWTAIR